MLEKILFKYYRFKGKIRDAPSRDQTHKFYFLLLYMFDKKFNTLSLR